MLAGIVVFMLIAFILYRNNRNRKKAHELLQKQKEEIEVQKKNVEETLIELKSTQATAYTKLKKWQALVNSLRALHMRYKTL